MEKDREVLPTRPTSYSDPFGGQPGGVTHEGPTYSVTNPRGSGVDLSWEFIEDFLRTRPFNGSTAEGPSLNVTPVTLPAMRQPRPRPTVLPPGAIGATGFEYPGPPQASGSARHPATVAPVTSVWQPEPPGAGATPAETLAEALTTAITQAVGGATTQAGRAMPLPGDPHFRPGMERRTRSTVGSWKQRT